MVLLAGSIPTLRPLVRKKETNRNYANGNSGSFAFGNLHSGSDNSRKNGDDQFYKLSDDVPAWPADAT